MDNVTALKELIAYKVAAICQNTFPYNVSILGGFPRDLHYGRSPKDADIFIHTGPQGEYLGENSSFLDRLQMNLPSFTIHHMKAYGESSDDDDFCERHHGVLKLKFSNPEFSVDILFTKTYNKEDSLEQFDCNLNQVAVEDADTGVVWLEGHPPETLRFRDYKLRPERIKKMTEYAEKYTDVPPVNFKVLDEGIPFEIPEVKDAVYNMIQQVQNMGFKANVESIIENYIKHPSNWAFEVVRKTPCSISFDICSQFTPVNPLVFFKENPKALHDITVGVV